MDKFIRKIGLCMFVLLLMVSLCGCGTSNPPNEENATNTRLDKNESAGIEQSEETAFSAFKLWMDAENTVSERYMYETIIDGFLVADDEMSRGWLDDGTKAFLRVIKGDTLQVEAPIDEYINAYRGLYVNIGKSNYCISDFFTVDDYNNSTNDGVYNFLDAIDQLEDELFEGRDLVTVTDNGVYNWDFDDAEVANALGISEELVTILMHAAVDAGFSVNFD